MSLNDSGNTIASFELSPIFIMMLVLWCHHFSLSDFLSPPKRVPLITGLQYLHEYQRLVLFVKTQFLIWIWDCKPARAWTRTFGTKSVYANHWATLHWLFPSNLSFHLASIYSNNFHPFPFPIKHFFLCFSSSSFFLARIPISLFISIQSLEQFSYFLFPIFPSFFVSFDPLFLCIHVFLTSIHVIHLFLRIFFICPFSYL